RVGRQKVRPPADAPGNEAFEKISARDSGRPYRGLRCAASVTTARPGEWSREVARRLGPRRRTLDHAFRQANRSRGQIEEGNPRKVVTAPVPLVGSPQLVEIKKGRRERRPFPIQPLTRSFPLVSAALVPPVPSARRRCFLPRPPRPPRSPPARRRSTGEGERTEYQLRPCASFARKLSRCP